VTLLLLKAWGYMNEKKKQVIELDTAAFEKRA